MRPKGELLRLVRGADGRARVDWRQREGGRGAYACPLAECLERAFGRGRLGHALKHATEPPPEGVEGILAARRDVGRVPARAK